MKEHHLRKVPFGFGGTWKRVNPLSLAPTCTEFVPLLQKEEHFLSFPRLGTFRLAVTSHLLLPLRSRPLLRHTSVLISPGPGGYSLGAAWARAIWPALSSPLVTERAGGRAGGRGPADRAKTGPKRCQDDRQAVG